MSDGAGWPCMFVYVGHVLEPPGVAVITPDVCEEAGAGAAVGSRQLLSGANPRHGRYVPYFTIFPLTVTTSPPTHSWNPHTS